jgi:glycosyltransferase involved in cell wall biosynthesis
MQHYLKEALMSVAKQTYRSFEVVVVDDASPLDISKVIEEIEPEMPSLRVIKNKTNLRHVGTRNRGIEESRGELISFLDHDDMWAPAKLEAQVQAFEENPEAGMVFCDIEVVGRKRNLLDINQEGVPIRPSFGYLSTHIKTVVTATAVMVKKDALLEIGGFDGRYTSCDDYDAWLKILMRRPIIRVPQKLAFYRLHEANVNYSVDSRNDNKLLTALIIGHWKKASLAGKVQLLPAVMRKLAGRIYYSLRAKSASPNAASNTE